MQGPNGKRGAPLRGAWGFSDGRQVYVFTASATGCRLGRATTSGRPTDYTLSLLTGRVLTPAEDDYVTTPDTVLLHIYCRKSSLGTMPEPLCLNDKAVGEISDNQFLIVPYTEYMGDVHLRLGTRKDRELVLQPDFLAPVYVKVVRYPNDKTRPWRWYRPRLPRSTCGLSGPVRPWSSGTPPLPQFGSGVPE